MKGKQKSRFFENLLTLGLAVGGLSCAFAASVTTEIYKLNTTSEQQGKGEKIGTISFEDNTEGLHIKTNLKKLPEGQHGFHIHENPSCEGGMKDNKWEAGHGAGGHLDPDHTGHHLGPKGEGHKGDLPFLTVDKKGEANETLVAPRLKLADVEGRSVIIHAGGDNYKDDPEMGGGGARIACGVIPKG